LWFYAAGQAKAEMAAWRERERQAGRQQDCASLSVGGYPMGIEVRCVGAGFEIEGTPSYRLDLPSVLATVQVYDRKLLTSELTGPLKISAQRGDSDYLLDWNVGRVTMRGLPSKVEHGSVVFDDLAIYDRAAGDRDPMLRARHFEMQGRQAVAGGDEPTVEAVLRLKQATAEKMHPAIARPTDADVTSVLRGMTELAPMSWPARLRQWQARNGEIDITNARIEQDDIIAVGTGTLRLTARGGLEGNLQVTIVGVEKVLRMFNLERLLSEGQIGAALNVLDQLIPRLGDAARRRAPGLAAALGHRS
jgi:hypothetical protein